MEPSFVLGWRLAQLSACFIPVPGMGWLAPSASTKLTEELSIQVSGGKSPPALCLDNAWFEAEASVTSWPTSIKAVFDGEVLSEGWPSLFSLVLSSISFPAACRSLMLFPLNKKQAISHSCRVASGINQHVSSTGNAYYELAAAWGGCTDPKEAVQRQHHFILLISHVATPAGIQGSSSAKPLLCFQQVFLCLCCQPADFHGSPWTPKGARKSMTGRGNLPVRSWTRWDCLLGCMSTSKLPISQPNPALSEQV